MAARPRPRPTNTPTSVITRKWSGRNKPLRRDLEMPVQAGIFFASWPIIAGRMLQGEAIMRKQRPLLLALAAGVTGGILLGSGAAQATAFCNIPSMPDGFLALRDQPAAKGKLVA